jgi:soluble P-type ATPase
MIKVEIPGYGLLALEHLVTDFSGTLSEDGKLLQGVREKLNKLSGKLKIHVLTSDTFGSAKKELEGINCSLHILTKEFISKTTPPHPCPLPPVGTTRNRGERGLIISPPLMRGDEGEGDTCGFTNDRVSKGDEHVSQKEKYVLSLGANTVVALGNGNNDVRMLRLATLGIAVCLREGCSTDALNASKILVRSPVDAIELLLYPKRLIATLRR